MRLSRRVHQQGNALLVTLMTTMVLGLTLASFLDLVSNQNISTMRSQQWNAAIPVLEAGIEESLTELYHNGTNLANNGWTLVNGVYTKSRVLGDSKYRVSISPGSKPVILAQGYVPAPFSTNFMPPRTVKVTVTNAPMYAKGMVAKGQINLNGNNLLTDSFDSSDPNYSTNGRYDPAKARDNGDIATDSSLTNSLSLGNANIHGHASTGPGGTIQVGPNGGIGSAAWQAAGNSGIEPGWTNDDMNVQFPDVQVPFAGGALTPASGAVNGTNYTYVLTDGDWQLASLSLSGKQQVYVGGNAVLYVPGSVSMAGQAQIVIATNATLNLYVGGASASLGGNGIANVNANATNFYYWGLPSNTSLSMSGNATFTGAIYAPEAAFSLGGGGNNAYNFVGASVTGSISMQGHFNFHYDENLGKVGPSRGYAVDSWNEVFSYGEQ